MFCSNGSSKQYSKNGANKYVQIYVLLTIIFYLKDVFGEITVLSLSQTLADLT